MNATLTRTRKAVRPVAAVGALAGLTAALTPVWATHHAMSLARTRRSTGASSEIPRVAIDDVDLDELLDRGSPVVVEGLLDRLDLDVRPDLDGLRSLAATSDTRFEVVAYDDAAPYFLYVGDYGREVIRRHTMTFAEFLTYMFDTGPVTGTCTYQLFGVRALDGLLGRVIDDMCRSIEQLVEPPTNRAASGVWIGSRGVITPLHHDAWPGLLFQTVGTKRVSMYAPHDRPNLYFSSPFDPTSTWSRLPGRSADADATRFPRYRRARAHETTLLPDDALYIPPFWAHEIEALEANVSIPFRFATRSADRFDPGFLRPTVEMLHRKLARSRG